MHKRFILRLCALGFIAILPTAAQEALLEASRPGIEQIVHQYILQHPEVLMESVRLYQDRSEEHTSELQSLAYLVCRLLLEKKKKNNGDAVKIHQTMLVKIA